MKLVKIEKSEKECRSCGNKDTNKRTFHYSVRGQMRGTKGVCTDYICNSCNFTFYR